jgi:hypothetical protein
MINGLKEDTCKQMNGVKQPIENLKGKFSKEIKILKKMLIFEMKSSIK